LFCFFLFFVFFFFPKGKMIFPSFHRHQKKKKKKKKKEPDDGSLERHDLLFGRGMPWLDNRCNLFLQHPQPALPQILMAGDAALQLLRFKAARTLVSMQIFVEC